MEGRHLDAQRWVSQLFPFIDLIALSILHDKKILHRDIKSANVFLCKDGTAKLGDMNVSKINKRGLLYT